MKNSTPTPNPTGTSPLKTIGWLLALLVLAFLAYQFYLGWSDPYGVD